MKKISTLLLLVSFSITVSAQLRTIKNPTVIEGVLVKTTVPLKDFVADANWKNEIVRDNNGIIGEKEEFEDRLHPSIDKSALPKGIDPALQQKIFENNTAARIAGLTQNFNGMGNTGVSPADPSLCAGPNHVLQMINGGSGAYLTIYDKNGTVALAQAYIDAISTIPGAGDPVALYDQLADRYFISEFSASGNKLVILISQTNNPLGSWYVYSFTAPSFPDYPHYGLWNTAYICTTNEVDNAVYAMDRTKMLAGNATATMQRFSIANSPTISFQASTPVCLEGTTPPPAGAPAMIMRMVDDAWTPVADVDRLEMWNLTLDFTTPANSVLAQQPNLNTIAFDTDLCGYTTLDCISQPSAQKLDPLREVLMNKIIYRNFGTHQSVVCNHTVDVTGTDRAGVRWYEVRKTGAAAWNIYQQGTYSPDGSNRWMGSICIDGSGAIGLAYNVSSSTVFPSIRFTGRKACDALGTMTVPETTVIAGATSQTSNRWGDYNSLCIDPSDNRTMWFTGMYMPAAGGWSTRVAAFDIAGCTPEISFGANTASVNESTGVTANNCRPYVDVITTVQIGQAPSQPATVTLTNTGTATLGEDYDLIYTTPIILDAANLSRNITVRVYNDGGVEPSETVILNYTFNANGGDAIAALSNQTYTLTINDDDFAPSPNDTLFVENFDAITTGLGTWTQTVISGTLNRWIVGANAGAGFAGKAAYVSDNTTTISNTYTITDPSSIRIESPTINTTGKTNLNLRFKYKCNGEFSGSTFYDYGQVLYSANGGAWTVLQTNIQGVTTATNQTIALPAAAENIANLKIGFQFICDNTVGGQPPFAVDSVYITKTGQNIQTAVNTALGFDEEKLGPNATVHFFDRTSGNIIATVTNLSAHDYGCTRIEVDRAGTSAVSFVNSSPANRLFSKTYKIIPTTNNASGNIKVKLYYTNAEVLGWQGVTGQFVTSCSMSKVSGNNSIGNVNAGNYTSYVITVLPATVGTFATGTTFETSFSNGFSGFGVGLANSVVLPVNFISFDGKFINKNQINLSWITASENGTRNFEVERSYDGLNFEKFATVIAAGNSTTTKNYNQIDNNFKRNEKNYYRLKMNDINGQFRYSEIVMLQDKNFTPVELFPNPVKDGILNIRLSENLINKKLNLVIYSSDGKEVLKKVLTQNVHLQQINITSLSTGSYTIQINDGKEKVFQEIFVVCK
jgi:Secretion system C-terminal sorting domain